MPVSESVIQSSLFVRMNEAQDLYQASYGRDVWAPANCVTGMPTITLFSLKIEPSISSFTFAFALHRDSVT